MCMGRVSGVLVAISRERFVVGKFVIVIVSVCLFVSHVRGVWSGVQGNWD